MNVKISLVLLHDPRIISLLHLINKVVEDSSAQ